MQPDLKYFCFYLWCIRNYLLLLLVKNDLNPMLCMNQLTVWLLAKGILTKSYFSYDLKN